MTPPRKAYLVMTGDRPTIAYMVENDAEIYVRRNNGEHEIVPIMVIDHATWGLVDS